MQQPYQGLARIYDYLLSGLNYQEWVDYLEQIFQHFSIQPCRRVVDLACGTGSSTLPWAMRGYITAGVDISGEMLAQARGKASAAGMDIFFDRQDMRSLNLPFSADVAVLYQDGLNYLLSEEELQKAFCSIRTILRPCGYFIFNLNLVDKLPSSSLPEVSWLEEEGHTLIWESSLQPEEKIWKIKLTAFVRGEEGLYEKIQEEHLERSYSRDEIEPLFGQTGWKMLACYRAFTFDQPAAEDRNILYLLQREG